MLRNACPGFALVADKLIIGSKNSRLIDGKRKGGVVALHEEESRMVWLCYIVLHGLTVAEL